MLKRDITYEDFDGEQVTETFYFNITRAETIEYQADHEGGMPAAMQRIIKANDLKAIIAEMKKLILLAYGTKSDDGKRFIKSEQLREEFSQSAAYDVLFMELATNDDAAATFIKGVLPKEFLKEVEKLQASSVPAMPAVPKD